MIPALTARLPRRLAAVLASTALLSSAVGVAAALLPAPVAAAQQEQSHDVVTLRTLLEEMTDRSAVARWPAQPYRMLQSSSFDRRSQEDGAPADAQTDEGWFANGDYGKYVRVEERDGRTEKVLMDVRGPGAIVRIWSANPDLGGTLRVYLDGAEEPVIEESFKALTDGSGPVAPPLSAVRSRGHNLYLPIPYAESCKVTLDGDPDNRVYYIINHRSYDEGTRVESFEVGDFQAEREAIAQAQERLSNPGEVLPAGGNRGMSRSNSRSILTPGARITQGVGAGPMALRELSVKVENLSGEELEEALRSVVLTIEADDQGELVRAPLGDFFGSGVGLNPFEGWYRTISEDGTMTCRWVMPFRESMTITIDNRGDVPATVSVGCTATDWEWDDRSMYFRANFRQERDIHTRPRQDFNYLTVEGQGVYVGDTLAIANPTPAWWGEGDEKVFVDNERFPSHFGTGTEDYYGYAWCWPDLFTAPFHAQPRCDGPDNFGHTTNTRVRALDAIPFNEAFRFDMEIWHWQEMDVAYASTAYWYARPGARVTGPAAEEKMDLAIPQLPRMHRLADVIEGESLHVLGKSDEFPVGRQMLFGAFEGDWSEGRHLWMRPREVGQWIDVQIPTPDQGAQHLVLWLTKAPDYGIVQLHMDGEPVGEPIDLYSSKVEPSEPVRVGPFTPKGPQSTLRFELVGANPAATGAKAFIGLDAIRIERD